MATQTTPAPAPAPAPTRTAHPTTTAHPVTDHGDHDLFAHYVRARPGAITEAYVLGSTVEALCGKVWVPSRDPKKYPVCPECDERHSRMMGK